MSFNTKPALRWAVVGAAAALLAACASHPKPAPEAPPPPPPPPAAEPAPVPPPPPVTSSILPGSAQDFVINVGDRVYFDTNKYEVRDDAQPVLSAQSAWLNRYAAVQVMIEGNCDERGTREYNLALGARRANSVREFLIAHGVDGARIHTISYGKERPIDPGTGDEAWAKNRNAHTNITSGAQ